MRNAIGLGPGQVDLNTPRHTHTHTHKHVPTHEQEDPRPFTLLAKELFPGRFKPTAAHYFIRLLYDKGLLLRCVNPAFSALSHHTSRLLS